MLHEPGGSLARVDVAEVGSFIPLTDDRGTVVGVVDITPGSATQGQVIEQLYYNSTGLCKAYYPDLYEKPRPADSDYNLGRSEYIPFGWCGMYRDEFTGLYHTHFREFDPLHNRWLSEDPAGYMDGLNLYAAYMGINKVDILGLDISFDYDCIPSEIPLEYPVTSGNIGILGHTIDSPEVLTVEDINNFLAFAKDDPFLVAAAHRYNSMSQMERDRMDYEVNCFLYEMYLFQCQNSMPQIGAWDGETGKIPDDTLYWWGVEDQARDTACNICNTINPLMLGASIRYKMNNYVDIVVDHGSIDFWNSRLGEQMLDDILPTWNHTAYVAAYNKNPYNRGRARFTQGVQYAQVAVTVIGAAKIANLYQKGNVVGPQSWNEFQSSTKGLFTSRAEAAAAWAQYKEANGIVIGATTARNQATKVAFLKQCAESDNYPRWMKQWLNAGKVPPGYSIDHIVPLSVEGLDVSSNMRLQAIDLHITHHKFYRPWE